MKRCGFAAKTVKLDEGIAVGNIFRQQADPPLVDKESCAVCNRNPQSLE